MELKVYMAVSDTSVTSEWRLSHSERRRSEGMQNAKLSLPKYPQVPSSPTSHFMSLAMLLSTRSPVSDENTSLMSLKRITPQ